MATHPIILPIAVDVIYCRFTSSIHASYSGAKIFPSGATQGPPDSLKILGFTARIYAIVRKDAVPAPISVLSLDPLASTSKNLPILELLNFSSILAIDSLWGPSLNYLDVFVVEWRLRFMLLWFEYDSLSQNTIRQRYKQLWLLTLMSSLSSLPISTAL